MKFYIVMQAQSEEDIYVKGEVYGGPALAGLPQTFEQERAYVENIYCLGPAAAIMTKGELSAVDGGKRALREWRKGDESTRTRVQDAQVYRDNCDDVRMMAERRGDPRAISLMQRGFPKIETRQFLHGSASEDWAE